MPEYDRQARQSRTRSPQGGRSFLMEAVILFAVLAACLAVIFSVDAAARATGTQADQLSRAVNLAQGQAEAFAADPQAAPTDATDDGLTASCAVEGEPTADGTLYHATITVTDQVGSTVYTLATSRYVGGGGR